jgi:hypothetical protein
VLRHRLAATTEESHRSPETENPHPCILGFSVRLCTVIHPLSTGNITSGPSADEFGLRCPRYFGAASGARMMPVPLSSVVPIPNNFNHF